MPKIRLIFTIEISKLYTEQELKDLRQEALDSPDPVMRLLEHRFDLKVEQDV